MSQALRKAGRPIIFSLCEWGANKPWLWASPVGQLWRTTGDIGNVFDGIKSQGTWHSNGVMTIVDMQNGLQKYAGPGHWNDPDMLEVGNGMTPAEDRTHFSMWCMLAAPLIAGNDLRKMSPQTAAILTDKELIAIDQDPLGAEGIKYAVRDSVEIWARPLQGGDWAICFLNRSSAPRPFSFHWDKESITDSVANLTLDSHSTAYNIHDLWMKKVVGKTSKPFSATIPAHDVIVLRLVNTNK
jgi:alpha-galactosidase